MINKTMTAKEARDNFTDLLGTVYYGKEPVVVEKKGRAFAVVINPEEYERLQKLAKEQFFKVAEKVQARNAQFSEEEVLADVTKAVEEVREAKIASEE
ncbi:hypothetical protein A2688_01360 [Candidatus Daviesbacteria bacterium RIFCSPHIGHO2_01_FULL_38_8]|nr:MAG: hypothetical protein A2688_01360 [Candidatus Daviesbacteria bacterium RIFCSPHIGHO2_01_FULL_38_8]